MGKVEDVVLGGKWMVFFSIVVFFKDFCSSLGLREFMIKLEVKFMKYVSSCLLWFIGFKERYIKGDMVCLIFFFIR